MIIWAAIEDDKYQRIYAVADSVKELAETLGIKPMSIYVHRARANKGLCPWKYIRIEIPDDEDEQQQIVAAVDYASDIGADCTGIEWIKSQALTERKNI